MLQRLTRFFVKRHDEVSCALYEAAVLQTRREEFYLSYEVADTIDGRFDLLLVHVWLLMRHFGMADVQSQKLFDLMFADMDRNLREMGVGDMSIGKKIKPMIAAFYGRIKAYEDGLDESPQKLAAALQRNLYGMRIGTQDCALAMAHYIEAAADALRLQTGLEAGKVRFIEPVPVKLSKAA